jgi:hypothetical protein
MVTSWVWVMVPCTPVRVNWAIAAVSGVPDRTPLLFNVKPAGRLFPLATDHTTGDPGPVYTVCE